MPSDTDDEKYAAELRARLKTLTVNPNNPNNEPTGHYTGRCRECGSNDLWDDNSAYGCNKCGALYVWG